MSKYAEERALFKMALEEAICNRFDKIIAESPMNSDCSEKHKRRMKKILKGEATVGEKCVSRGKLIAALIAAAILLTGCTIYVFRNEIKGFFEYVYETYICVERDVDSTEDKIDDVYYLSYVPEGFELKYESSTYAQTTYRWMNTKEEQLLFIQTALINKFYIDIDDGYTKIIEHNGISIYNREGDNYKYIWCDGKNYFSLVSYVEICTDELIKILDGMTIKQ